MQGWDQASDGSLLPSGIKSLPRGSDPIRVNTSSFSHWLVSSPERGTDPDVAPWSLNRNCIEPNAQTRSLPNQSAVASSPQSLRSQPVVFAGDPGLAKVLDWTDH